MCKVLQKREKEDFVFVNVLFNIELEVKCDKSSGDSFTFNHFCSLWDSVRPRWKKGKINLHLITKHVLTIMRIFCSRLAIFYELLSRVANFIGKGLKILRLTTFLV